MDIHECSFCRIKLEPGTGTMFVKKDGSVFYFCGSKCERNMLMLERTPRKMKWTRILETKKPVPKEEPEKAKKQSPKKDAKTKKTPAKKQAKGK